MKSVCIIFQVHQPIRLRPYSFFELGRSHHYYNQALNEQILQRVAERCYLPMNQLLLDEIRHYGKDFRVSFSISGVALEQFRRYTPQVIDSFQRLAETDCVEFLGNPYAHSLAALYSPAEFTEQVEMQQRQLASTFGQHAVSFCNTDLLCTRELGSRIAGGSEEYYWYTTSTGGTSVGTGSSYSTPSISATTTFYVTLKDIPSGCESYPRTPVIASIYTAPTIDVHPVSESADAGSTTSFSVEASGINLSYQWQVNPGTGWVNITSAGTAPVYAGWTSSTLVLSGVQLSNNTYQYRCNVTGICGFTTSSNAAILTVSNLIETYLHPSTGYPGIRIGTCMVATCDGNYYDDGGASAGYATNITNINRTFCPNAPYKAVRATINNLDVAYTSVNCNDLLYVYNGPNESSSYLWVGCGTSGTAIYTAAGAYNSGIITSTHQSGCLTFAFSSGTTNASGSWDGWNISLSCVDFPGGPSGTANTDCINSTPICSDISASSYTYGPGITSDACTGCVTSEFFVEWYRIRMATGGTIQLEIVPNGVSDLDFALYKTNNCGALGDPVRCSYAARTSPGKTGMKIGPSDVSEDVYGDQWVMEVNASAGESFYLMINEWNKPNPNQYTLNWTLTNGASFDCSIVLPVSMLDFYAERQGNEVLVNWVTASESNNDFFTLERSEDGEHFQALGMIDGAGNSNKVISYSFTDHFPIIGTAYYRIKQTDFDGKFEYTHPVAVNFSDVEAEFGQLSLFPNPAENYISVQSDRFLVDKPFMIFNPLGACVLKGELNSTYTRIQLDQIKSNGLYLLVVDGFERQKFYITGR